MAHFELILLGLDSSFCPWQALWPWTTSLIPPCLGFPLYQVDTIHCFPKLTDFSWGLNEFNVSGQDQTQNLPCKSALVTTWFISWDYKYNSLEPRGWLLKSSSWKRLVAPCHKFIGKDTLLRTHNYALPFGRQPLLYVNYDKRIWNNVRECVWIEEFYYLLKAVC